MVPYARWCAAVAHLVVTAAVATAQNPEWAKRLTRDDTAKLFAEGPQPAGRGSDLVRHTIDGETVDLWNGPAPRFERVEPKKDCPVAIGVKVWAELSDEAGTHTSKFINPDQYFWRPGQRLYLWFQTTAPAHLAVIERQDAGTGLAPGGPGVLRSPDPKFPKTYSVVPPRVAYRYPQLYTLDDTPKPEFLTLLLVGVGAKVPDPQQPTGDGAKLALDSVPPNGTGLKEAITKQNEQLDTYAKKLDNVAPAMTSYLMGRFEPTSPQGGKTGGVVSPVPDPVATVLLGPHPFGFQTVRIYKAVPAGGR